jgi:hypothetical protein
MTVRFSAPVPRELAAQVRLRPAAGAPLAPVFDKDDKAVEVREIAFPRPLAENAAFSVEMPATLRDNAGRALANASSFPLKVQTGSAPPIAKFAAAPFGIVERNADAMLPVTLRHVQVDLRAPGAGASAAPPTRARPPRQRPGRVKRLQSDADILAWYARLQKYHETQLTAKELGLPGARLVHLRGGDERQGPRRQAARRQVRRHARGLAARQGSGRDPARPAAARGGDPRPFEVVGIPLPEPGYHVVEIESLRLGQSLLDKRAPMFVRTGVLVTNLGVHFKLGRENSVVWVTTLDRGKPVEGAQVVVNDCNGKPLWNGKSDAKGLAVVARSLEPNPETCVADSGYFVSARSGRRQGRCDVAFVFSSWQKGIESWRFNVPTGRGAEPDLRASTVFDRSLFRAGETVSMKHFVRVETSRGLAPVPATACRLASRSFHQGSGQEVVVPLTWTGAGRSALTTWNIPPAAKLGVYEVVLEREAPAGRKSAGDDDERRRERTWSSGSFRVEEFRLPLVDARVSGPKGPQVAASGVAIDVQMSYFSGGPMGSAPLRASALLKTRSPSFAGYDGVPLRAGAGPESARFGGARKRRRRARRERPRRQADRRQGGADDRSQRHRPLRPEGLAEDHSAGADRRRGDVQRSERRDADRGDADRSLAERARPRRQGGQLGQQPRQRQVQRRRPRHAGQADQGPARRSARPGQPGRDDEEAPGRRLLRLRQPHRREGPRQPVHGVDRRARPARLRGEPRLGRAGRADRARR